MQRTSAEKRATGAFAPNSDQPVVQAVTAAASRDTTVAQASSAGRFKQHRPAIAKRPRLKSACYLAGLIALLPGPSFAEYFYSAPYYVPQPYGPNLGFSTTGEALDYFWKLYQDAWPVAKAGQCGYALVSDPNGRSTGHFGDVLLQGVCTGAGNLFGTAYPYDPGKNLGGVPELCAGNPITLSTGNKLQVETDFTEPGEAGLIFKRTYNSSPATQNGTVGQRWRHGYDSKIEVAADATTSVATVYRPSGAYYRFTLTQGQWVTDADITDTLRQDLDGTGAVTGWRYVTASGETDLYDAAGKLTAIITPTGQKQTLAYDAAGHLVSVTDTFGRQLTFAYDTQNRVATVTQPDNGLIQYAYDANGNLSTVTYPDGKVRTYVYEDIRFAHALTGIIDENGARFATWSYDGAERAVSSEHAGGAEKVTLSYDGTSTSMTDAIGTARTNQLTTVLGVIRNAGASQPGGVGCGAAGSALTYDANGNVASRTDFNGNTTTYAYDLARNLETQRIEAAGKPEARTVTTQWHGYWHHPVQVAEPLKRTTYVYNGDGGVFCAPQTVTVPSLTGGRQPIGVLCSKTEQATSDANGSQGLAATLTGTPRTWKWTYNAYGQVLTADGPRTDVTDLTTYTYFDAADPDLGKRGNIATVTNALGHVTRITAYDGNGHPLTILDPNGVPTTLAYDARGRLVSKTVGTEITTYAYDGVGQLLKVTLPDGSYTAYTYDDAHRLVQIADALGDTITYTLDALGNRTQETVKDPAGHLARTRTRVYDALSRLAQDIGAQNQTTAYQYDANGNRTKVTDPLGQATVSGYDALNRLITLTDPGQGVTRYGYNGQDRLTQVTDPRALITRYTVDGLGNALGLNSPDTGTTSRTFDAAGNEVSRTDAKGQKTTTTYDALNRPKIVTYADGRQERYTWDIHDTYGIGRLIQISEYVGGQLTGLLQYTYDAQGRLTRQTRSIGSLSQDIHYAYRNGQLSKLTLPSGRQIAYTRNAAGQVTALKLTDNGQSPPVTQTLAQGIAYAPFGGLAAWTDGAGQTHTRAYDQDGRITSYSLGAQTWLLTYDSAGRITGQIDGSNAGNSAVYGYDPLGHLTGASLPSTTYGYAYDADGNRTQQTTNGASRAYTLDSASNRLTQVGNPATAYSYDQNGSTTGDGTATYAFDARGRLIRATAGANVAQYQVNALGERVRKTDANGDTVYHYDAGGHLIAEASPDGYIFREYVWLGDTPIAVLDPNAVAYLHTDHLDTPRLVTDATGKTIWRRSPLGEPFGATPPEEDPDGDGVKFVLNLRFPGQYFDRETNTNYNYFRTYDFQTGRYHESDPIGLKGGINTYLYSGANPILFTDSKGLDFWVENGGSDAGGLGFHQRICVGTPGSGRICYSLAVDEESDCCGGLFSPIAASGRIYVDEGEQGKIAPGRLAKSSSETDLKIILYLNSLLGKKIYNIFINNCRTFSNEKFWQILDEYPSRLQTEQK